MREIKKRLTAVFLTIAMIVGMQGVSLYCMPVCAKAASAVTITLLNTNDIHGNFSAGVGIARVAALKKQSENAILLDAGDATQGVPLAVLSKGEHPIRLMNAAGYDGMTLGNHEFDYGQEQLLKNVGMAEFPIVSANVRKGTEPLTKGIKTAGGEENNGAHFMLERSGIKIGVFGLTTRETTFDTKAALLEGLTFADEIVTAKEQVDELESEGADVIICLAHMGDSPMSGCTAEDLAVAMTGKYQGKLDIIVDGHSHTRENKKVNGVQINQTGTALSAVCRTTIKVENGEVSIPEEGAELLTGEELKNIEPDAGVAEILNEINKSMEGTLETEIAVARNSIWGGTINGAAEARVTETNYGDLIADSLRTAAQEHFSENPALEEQYRKMPVVAVQNGGGIRAKLSNGRITMGNLIETLPFGNEIQYKAVTPSILYAMMEQSFCMITGQDVETGCLTGETDNIANGGYLQVSGMHVVFEPAKPLGEKVLSITLDGETEPLSRTDEKRGIILSAIDYIMNGGSGYSMLPDVPLLGRGGADVEVLLQEINRRTENGTKKLDMPVTEKRIEVKSDYVPKDYVVHIRVKNTDGSIAAGEKVSYYIDNRLMGMAETDNEGLLNLSVPDGAHAVKLYATQEEVYVNNHSGAGVIMKRGAGIDYPVLVYDKDLNVNIPETEPIIKEVEKIVEVEKMTEKIVEKVVEKPVEKVVEKLVVKVPPNKIKITTAKRTGRKIKVKFKRAKDSAVRYQIQFRAVQKKKWKTAGTTTKGTYTIKNIKSKKKYYIRVRSCISLKGKKYYGSYGKVYKL